jgi:hypothetical protein
MLRTGGACPQKFVYSCIGSLSTGPRIRLMHDGQPTRVWVATKRPCIAVATLVERFVLFVGHCNESISGLDSSSSRPDLLRGKDKTPTARPRRSSSAGYYGTAQAGAGG